MTRVTGEIRVQRANRGELLLARALHSPMRDALIARGENTMKHLGTVVGFMASLCALGCSTFHAYSPGTRLGTVEGPGTLQLGQYAVGFSGGSSSMLLFSNDSVTHFAGRGRAGLVPNLDGAIDLAVSETVATALDPTLSCMDSRCSQTVRRSTFHSRAGLKWEIAPRVLSLMAGVGVGSSELGEFFSPDVGMVIGYENPYFVPFLSWTLGVSLPFNSRNVTVAHVTDTAHRTRIEQVALGFRIPVGERISETQRRFSLGAANVYTAYRDATRSDLYFGFVFAFEAVIE